MGKIFFISEIVCGFFLVVVLWSLFGMSNGKNIIVDEQQIKQLIHHIPIGASPEEVKNVFASLGNSRLTLQEIDSHDWLITTPMRFGASNWDLWVSFNEGKVEFLKVRMADSKLMHPADAPPDKCNEPSPSKP